MPIHVQLNPTNKCVFSCSFCSCSSRDKSLELDFTECTDAMSVAKAYGCKSVTITGGGEPLLYRYFSEMVDELRRMKVDVGLVTNGALMDKVDLSVLDKLTWIRISASDELKTQMKRYGKDVDSWFMNIGKAVKTTRRVDWSFSFVLTQESDFMFLVRLVNFANRYNFTHIRVVNDILNVEKLTQAMAMTKHYFRSNHFDDHRVIYQDRATWTKGSNPCYISLLKPVIGADGYIYPCCGAQYALADPARDYEKTMRMANISDVSFENLFQGQQFFDGSKCVKCYYSGYNDMLRVLMNGLQHVNFV